MLCNKSSMIELEGTAKLFWVQLLKMCAKHSTSCLLSTFALVVTVLICSSVDHHICPWAPMYHGHYHLVHGLCSDNCNVHLVQCLSRNHSSSTFFHPLVICVAVTVLCKSNANELRRNSWLSEFFKEISLCAIFPRQIAIVRRIFATPIVWNGPIFQAIFHGAW